MNRYSMSRSNLLKSNAVWLLVLLFASHSMGQISELKQSVLSYTTEARSTAENYNSKLINSYNFPAWEINTAKGNVKLVFADLYTIPENYTFTINVKVTLGLDPNSLVLNSEDIKLSKSNPESMYYFDFTEFAKQSRAYLFDQVINVTVTSSNTTQNITYQLSYDIDLGINFGASILRPTITNSPPQSYFTNRKIKLDWECKEDNVSLTFPNYEVQLLRLYNTDKTKTQPTDIVAEINWDQALTFKTESHETQTQLSIAEGSGFYIWRVRPLVSSNTLENSRIPNYRDDNWSEHATGSPSFQLQGSTVMVNSEASLSTFYFSDPDENRNYIYSRIFTEENKVKEVMTYANGLQQVKQQQTYLPSKNTRIVTQTVHDASGRPALNTMPIPVPNSVINSYIPQFIKPAGSADVPYSASHFDSYAKIYAPDKIKQGNTSYLNTPLMTEAADYYSDRNSDLNVPSADGYPFQRTLFTNDGTDRPVIQTGVGKTHMIGQNSNPIQNSILQPEGDGGGKVIKTDYATASDEELVKLFGIEAPKGENVMKTVTTDQNGVSSISYTNFNGQVIATSLVLKDNDNSGVLKPLGNEPNMSSSLNKDIITNNSKNDTSLTSSKRIVVTKDNSALNIYYKYSNTDIQPCVDNACAFDLYVIVKNVNNPAWKYDHRTKDATERYVDFFKVNAHSCKQGSDGCFIGQLNLPAGTYIIEKVLRPQSIVAVATVSPAGRTGDVVVDITNIIKEKLKQIKCPQDVVNYYGWLRTFVYDFNTLKKQTAASDSLKLNFANFYNVGADKLANIQSFELVALQKSFDEKFLPSPKPGSNASYIPEIDAADAFNMRGTVDYNLYMVGTVKEIVLSSVCCGSTTIDVQYTPPFKCPKKTELATMRNFSTATIDVSLPAPSISSSIPTYIAALFAKPKTVARIARYTPANNSNGSFKINTNLVDELSGLIVPAQDFARFFPDFEGYAISVLKRQEAALKNPELTINFLSWEYLSPDFKSLFNGVKDDDKATQNAIRYFYSQMTGWAPGDFNIMASKMLGDQYSSQNPADVLVAAEKILTDVKNVQGGFITTINQGKGNLETKMNPVVCHTAANIEDKKEEVTPVYCYNYVDNLTNNAYRAACSMYAANTINTIALTPQYHCSHLINCWNYQIQDMIEQLTGVPRPVTGAGGSTQQGVQNQQDGSTKDSDDQFDQAFEQFGFFAPIVKWMIGDNIAEKMRKDDNSGVSSERTTLAKECRLKDFLNCTGYKFAKIITPSDFKTFPGDDTYTAETKVSTPASSTPPRFEKWSDVMIQSDADLNKSLYIKDLFPNIKHPHYAFKYFEYQENFKYIEPGICYNDPNDCEYTKTDGTKMTIPCCLKTLPTVAAGNTTSLEIAYRTSIDNLLPNDLIALGSDSQYGFCKAIDEIDGLPLGNSHFNYRDPAMGTTAADANAKLIVRNFYGNGERVCKMTHKQWNAGQRFTFYTMLKSEMSKPKGASGNVIPPKNYKGDNYDGPNLNAADYYNVQLIDFNESDSRASALLGLKESEKANWRKWNNIAADASFHFPSRVEYEIKKQNNTCFETCQTKKSIFKMRLSEKLMAAGYQIGGCVSPKDKVIYDEEIDDLVDKFVTDCNSLCHINSFAVTTYPSRYLDSPLKYTSALIPNYDKLGPNGNQEPFLRYGMGDAACNVELISYKTEVLRKSNTSLLPMLNYSAAFDPYNKAALEAAAKIKYCELKEYNIVMRFEDFDVKTIVPFTATTNSQGYNEVNTQAAADCPADNATVKMYDYKQLQGVESNSLPLSAEQSSADPNLKTKYKTIKYQTRNNLGE